jgi:hypothetical protein
MADGVVQISPFMSMVIGLLFTFSTIYGLMFYFYQGEAQQELTALGDTPNDPSSISQDTGFIGSFISGTIDAILNMVTWISPFALIRGLIFLITPSDLFQALDIFILRPMSWAVTIITGNWIIAAIRGKSEGT